MGKQTQFHPVSLNVLRGAAEFSGFKLGKLRQIIMHADTGSAWYNTDLLKVPEDLRNSALHLIRERLNACYSSDVNVTGIWQTRSGQIKVELHAQVSQKGESPLTKARSYESLSEDEKRTIPF